MQLSLQLTHARHEPPTMRLLGWRHYRIIKIWGGDGDRRGSAGLIIIVAARLAGDGPFQEAACTAVCQGDAHLKFSFEGIFQEYMGRVLKFTTICGVMVKVQISSTAYLIFETQYNFIL